MSLNTVTLASDGGARRVFSILSRAVRSIATNDEFVVARLAVSSEPTKAVTELKSDHF
jgi:hypothetical protein